MTGDGKRFALLNASPDVLTQIARTPALSSRGPRHSPIEAVVLTNGDLDHVLGLFSLRESTSLVVYATDAVWRGLEASVFLRTFARFPGHFRGRRLMLGEEIELEGPDGSSLGLRIRAIPLPGKPPLHLEPIGSDPSDNVGLVVRDELSRGSLFYAPTCARIDDPRVFDEHDVVLFDGTFFTEDELVSLGLGAPRAREMAHLPIEESLPVLSRLHARSIYTHVNNTNPVLGPTSARARVLDAGVEIAFDGMEVTP